LPHPRRSLAAFLGNLLRYRQEALEERARACQQAILREHRTATPFKGNKQFLPTKALHHLRPPDGLAQALGEELERGESLLGRLPPSAIRS